MRKIAKLIISVFVFFFCFEAYACQDFGETCVIDSNCCGGMTCSWFGCDCEDGQYPNYCDQNCWSNCSSGYEFICTNSGGECHKICEDQCSYSDLLNSPYCDGFYSLTCQSSNGCLVENGQSCAFNCNPLTGACNSQPYDPCKEIKCYNNDEYCYDSNNVRQEKYDECGSDEQSCSQPYCKSGKVVYDDIDIDRGCTSNSCFENDYSSTVTVETCACGCSNGSCISPCCTNDCSPSGKKECINATSIKTCGNYDTDSCYEWGSFQSCQCFNDACQTCINECTYGQVGCSTNNLSKWTCSQSIIDGCWDKVNVSCGTGKICSNGTCIDNCTNDCSPSGKKECINATSIKTCGNYDTDSCYEWGSFQSCQCFDNACQTCTNECISGDIGCSANATSKWTCVQSFIDGCWDKSYATCSAGLTCTNGNCSTICSNECTAQQALNSPYCEGSASLTCTLGSDDCYNESGQSCSYDCNIFTGNCNPVPVCTNECAPLGVKECIDAVSIQTCGNYDADSCNEWGSFQSCQCFNDACQTCINECTSGQIGCSTNNLSKWTCAQNIFNGCWETVTVNCSSGTVCNNGICVTNCLPSQDHKACSGTDLVWKNACNVITEVIEDCTKMPTICDDTLNGLWSEGFCSTQDLVCYYGKNTICECGCESNLCISPCCENECSQASYGCQNSDTAWICNYNSLTKCYEKEFVDCPINVLCSNGSCQSPVEDCKIISAYWDTGIPESPDLVFDGTEVSIVIVTQGCVGRAVDITIKEDSILFLPDDYVFGVCAYIPENGILNYHWNVAYWDNYIGGKLFDYVEILWEYFYADLYASVKIIGTNVKVETDILKVLPSVATFADLSGILEENPIVQMSECLNYSTDEATEECMLYWQELGLEPMHYFVEFINNEDVRLVGTIIVCKSMEYGGWMICAGGTLGTLGLGAPVACVVGGGVVLSGVLCDIFFLPEETFVIDQALMFVDFPGFATVEFANIAKGTRKAKVLSYLMDASKKYLDEGYSVVKQVVTDQFGGMLKIVKGKDARIAIYTFREGAEDATKIVYREIRILDDFEGSKQLLDWVQKWDIPFYHYSEASTEMLEEACSWFKNGNWEKSFDDVKKIANNINVDTKLYGIELVDSPYFFAANQNGLLKFSTKIETIGVFTAAEQLYGHAVQHGTIHSIFHQVFVKIYFSKTPASNLIYDNIAGTAVVVNPALEFIVDDIYLRNGKLELVTKFKAIGAEKLIKQYTSMKNKWIDWFKATGVWSDPKTSSLARAYALADKYGIPGFKAQIESDLLYRFAAEAPQSVKDEAIVKLQNMAAELTVDSEFIVNSLKHVSETASTDDAITQNVLALVIEKYKIYEAGIGELQDISDYSLADDGLVSDCAPGVYTSCFDDQIISYNSCGEFESILETCEVGYECVEGKCNLVINETENFDSANFKTISTGCQARTSWLIHNIGGDTAIKNCYVDFGDGSELTKCSFEILSPAVMKLFAEHGYEFQGVYSISMEFQYKEEFYNSEIIYNLNDCSRVYEDNLLSDINISGIQEGENYLIYPGKQMAVKFKVNYRPGMNGFFASDFAEVKFLDLDNPQENFTFVARNMESSLDDNGYWLEYIYYVNCNVSGFYNVSISAIYNDEAETIYGNFKVQDLPQGECLDTSGGCSQSTNSQPHSLVAFALLMLILYLFKRKQVIN